MWPWPLAVLVVAAVVGYLSWIASRIARLETRVDAARVSLDVQLERRATAVLEADLPQAREPAAAARASAGCVARGPHGRGKRADPGAAHRRRAAADGGRPRPSRSPSPASSTTTRSVTCGHCAAAAGVHCCGSVRHPSRCRRTPSSTMRCADKPVAPRRTVGIRARHRAPVCGRPGQGGPALLAEEASPCPTARRRVLQLRHRSGAARADHRHGRG